MGVRKPDLSDKVAFITGTTRGIGKQFALTLAKQGCNIVSTGKTTEPREGMSGTIYQTASEVRNLGVEAIAVQLDVRDEANVEAAVEQAVDEWGRIDIVVNNAGAIQLGTIDDVPESRYDLLMDVNLRGTYAVSRQTLPHLREKGGQIVTCSPPVSKESAPNMAAYAASKLGMTILTKSIAAENRGTGIVGNTLWPVTGIESRATRYHDESSEDDWRSPEIMADALLQILAMEGEDHSGDSFYDEEVLREAGITDFEPYNVTPGSPAPDCARMFDPTYERPDNF